MKRRPSASPAALLLSPRAWCASTAAACSSNSFMAPPALSRISAPVSSPRPWRNCSRGSAARSWSPPRATPAAPWPTPFTTGPTSTSSSSIPRDGSAPCRSSSSPPSAATSTPWRSGAASTTASAWSRPPFATAACAPPCASPRPIRSTSAASCRRAFIICMRRPGAACSPERFRAFVFRAAISAISPPGSMPGTGGWKRPDFWPPPISMMSFPIISRAGSIRRAPRCVPSPTPWMSAIPAISSAWSTSLKATGGR